MASSSAKDRLQHMLKAMEGIERLTTGKSLTEYQEAPDQAAAVERYLEIISEASRHIPQDRLSEYPDIPWRQVADIGNVLRHAYERLDAKRVWKTVRTDLPPLKNAVQRMLAELDEQP
ncbi:DUF86 domain-containing protein [Magnetospira sp. QH-2]|uniref:HepT-like ribonuclease domain-containing protein n=1 Tax=Magnetospira sp. (strain QH-2) TaxID=1288970 RepID=UPI0003E80B65|nr:HepT-like ribonuclease domain-containing protein [Magnetospira sp. QH-2]CCQ75221.1 conserved protein of unknown function [Magnetospira sp. QH-2]